MTPPEWVYVDDADFMKLEPLPGPDYLKEWEIEDGAVARGPFVVERYVDGKRVSTQAFYRLSFSDNGEGRVATFGDDHMRVYPLAGRVTRRNGVITARTVNPSSEEVLHFRPLALADAATLGIEESFKSVRQMADYLMKYWGADA